MNKYQPIDSHTLLSLINPQEIKHYLQYNGYPFVLTDDEMQEREDSIMNQEVLLSSCTDWQFEQEAEQRNYYFPDLMSKAEKIVEMIRLGKDWHKEAIEYFSDVTGKIL